MPQIYNGCGTWYYGKKNLQEYQGVCRHCHRESLLKSYDTRLYVVIVMIPVFPLGARHIVEQCSVCKRHGVVPLSDYRAAQERAKQAIAAYRAAPGNSELAIEALRGCVAYRNLPAFLELGPEIERNLSMDSKTLRMLAGAHDVFGRTADAERALRSAMAAADDEETREALADCLMRMGKPEEAEPLLGHIVEKGMPDRVNALVNLAQGYQLKGKHDDALRVYEHCEAINPLVAQNPAFKRLRDLSAENLGKSVAVNPAAVLKKDKAKAARKKFFKIAPVVIALALLAYAAVAWIEGIQHKVYLVSGMDKAYTAKINGKDYVVQPDAAMPIRISEGDVKIEIPGTEMPEQTVSVRSGFLLRPFASDAFVINPDGAAIVEKVKVFYSATTMNGGGGPSPVRDYYGGEMVHHFESIDCPFEEFPKSVSVDSGARDASRVGLTLVKRDSRITRPHLLMFLAERIGNDATIRIAQRHVLMEGDSEDYLGILRAKMEPAAAVEFLRPGLAKRPVRVSWHRQYQDAMELMGKEADVEAEYNAMLAAEPGNSDLIYLTGRTTNDPQKREEFFKRATTANQPCAFAFYSLCKQEMSQGKFHEAAAAGLKLRDAMRETAARWSCRKALIADGQLDLALSMAKTDQAGDLPTKMVAFGDEMYVLALKQEKAEIDNALGQLRAQMNGLDQSEIDQVIQDQQAENAYVSGDWRTFVAVLRPSSEPASRWRAAIANGDVAGADHAAGDVKKPSDELHLLMYIAAQQHHENAIGDEHLKAAVEMLSKGSADDRRFAAALSGKSDVKLADLLAARDEPEKKAMLLTAVGYKAPAMREACFAMARTLNFDKRFPHILIESAILTAGQ